MSASISALFSPLTIPSEPPTTLRNRIVMAALTRSRSVPTNVPNSINVEYYRQRARGGAGLIITEGTLVTQQGSEWQNAPGIWSAEQVAGWKKVVDAVHSEGGHIYSQLWNVGRVAHPDAPEQKLSGQPVYGPSAIAARGGKFRFIDGVPGYVTPSELADPQVVVDQFKQGAINAKEAGFDGVQLHGANGYLIHQFLDSTSNLRTDAWGGSPEKRARFALELLKVCVEVMGKGRVSIKLTPTGGYNDMGMPLQDTIDTYSYFLTEADKLGLAFIEIVRYGPAFDPIFDGKTRATQHDTVKTYKPFVKNTLFFVNGGLSPSEANELIESKVTDAAVFGWLWIGHPDLAKRIEQGKPIDTAVDFATLYGAGGEEKDTWKGYGDYPEAT